MTAGNFSAVVDWEQLAAASGEGEQLIDPTLVRTAAQAKATAPEGTAADEKLKRKKSAVEESPRVDRVERVPCNRCGDWVEKDKCTPDSRDREICESLGLWKCSECASLPFAPKNMAKFAEEEMWKTYIEEKMGRKFLYVPLSSFRNYWSAQVVDHKTLGQCYRIDLESEDRTSDLSVTLSEDGTKLEYHPLDCWVNQGYDAKTIRTKYARIVDPILGECYCIDAAAVVRPRAAAKVISRESAMPSTPQAAPNAGSGGPPAAKKAKLSLGCEETNKNKAFAEKVHRLHELLQQSLAELCSVAQDRSMLAGMVVAAEDIGLPEGIAEQASDWIDGDGWALPNVEIVKGLVAKAKESEKLLVRIAAMTGKRAARDAD